MAKTPRKLKVGDRVQTPDGVRRVVAIITTRSWPEVWHAGDCTPVPKAAPASKDDRDCIVWDT